MPPARRQKRPIRPGEHWNQAIHRDRRQEPRQGLETKIRIPGDSTVVTVHPDTTRIVRPRGRIIIEKEGGGPEIIRRPLRRRQ
jgi:hypothetical protein